MAGAGELTGHMRRVAGGLGTAAARLRQIADSRFARDAAVLGGSTVLAQGIGLLALPLIAYFYSPSDFGVFTLFVAAVTLSGLVATWGFEETVIVARGDRVAAHILYVIGFISLLVACAIVLAESLAIFWGTGFLSVWSPGAWIITFPVALFAVGMAAGLRFWSMRRRRFSTVARSEVTRAGVFVVVAFALGVLPADVFGSSSLPIAYTVAELSRLSVLAVACRREDVHLFARPTLKRGVASLRRNGRLATVMLTNKSLQLWAFRLPHMVLGTAFGAGVLGLYAMAERIVGMPSQVVAKAMSDVFRQRAAVLYLKTGEFREMSRRTLQVTAVLALIPFALAIWFAPQAFEFVLGPEWAQAGQIAQVLLVGEVFGFVVGPISYSAVIVGANRYLFWWPLTRFTLMAMACGLVVAGMLSLVQFLWLLVGIRVLMVSVEGVCNYRFSGASWPSGEVTRVEK